MRACLFSLAVFVSSLPLIAQSKHPFTFEDMMALKRVEEPEVSPDGKWVLFAAVDVDLKANTKTPHVWVVPLNQTQGPHSTPSQGSVAQGRLSTSLGMTESKEQRNYFGSGCGPAALGAGWEALCICFDERKWIANLDRGFRWRDRNGDWRSIG